MLTASPVHQILDLARWAPSGDNTQPWRFELLNDRRFVIHGFDTRAHCVYDLDGRPSQISLGALIETISIAASGFGLRADIRRRPEYPDTCPTFEVELVAHATEAANALFAAIPVRSVQRRPFSIRRLSGSEKATMEAVLDPAYRVRWLEGPRLKWRTALLMFANAKLRLTTEEAYRVHRDVIDWGCRYSPDRVPDKALGVDVLTAKLMRWIMSSWGRVCFFNRYLAGTWLPRLQMDFLPSLRCGAHFVLFCEKPPKTVEDYIEAGRMVQRFWLTATSLGLMQQPELTPLIFARYVHDGVRFSTSQSALELATQLTEKSVNLLGPELPKAVWIGRVGCAVQPFARSTRKRLLDMLTSS